MVDPAYQTRTVSDVEQELHWQCPYCNHSLQYRSGNDPAAKLAMVSHMSRCHKMTYLQILGALGVRYIKAAAQEFFGKDPQAESGIAKADCASGYIRFSP